MLLNELLYHVGRTFIATRGLGIHTLFLAVFPKRGVGQNPRYSRLQSCAGQPVSRQNEPGPKRLNLLGTNDLFKHLRKNDHWHAE